MRIGVSLPEPTGPRALLSHKIVIEDMYGYSFGRTRSLLASLVR